MATKVFMEALSPTMEEGRLVKWLKNEGDAVKSGDVLAEVETDKAVMELVARGDGVLRKRLVADGSTTPVGQMIGVIAMADENIDALAGGGAAPAAKSAAPAADSAAPVAAAAVGASPPAEGTAAPPDAAPAPPPATGAPTQPQAAAAPAEARATGPRTRPGQVGEPATEQPPHADDNGGRQRSSPLARRLATERGLDIGQVRGSGPGGRIVKRDIEAAASTASGTAAAPKPAAAPAQAAAPRIPRDGDFHDVPLSPMRKTIAKRLAESIGPIPTFYLTAEFDMQRVSELRSAMLELGPDYKVSFNDILLKAVATALAQHPEINAHWMGDKIRFFNRVHLGMAVAIDEGLITPVIFDADQKRMSEISREARELAKRARERKLRPDEYTGATFSVSNLGMFGIDHFTAIINPPEAAILAVGAVEEKAVVVDGQLVVRQRMGVTLSCDHRVIDGALGAKFLVTLRRLIENPLMLVF